jgi:hypothetical protein
MTTNPFYNALLAIAYIVAIVSLMFWGSSLISNDGASILYPIGALSTLTLSVAVMAYLFFYRPVLMLISGERERGVKLFLHTVGVFAGITAIVLLISLFVNR